VSEDTNWSLETRRLVSPVMGKYRPGVRPHNWQVQLSPERVSLPPGYRDYEMYLMPCAEDKRSSFTVRHRSDPVAELSRPSLTSVIRRNPSFMILKPRTVRYSIIL
jgi:hypothetical protein